MLIFAVILNCSYPDTIGQLFPLLSRSDLGVQANAMNTSKQPYKPCTEQHNLSFYFRLISCTPWIVCGAGLGALVDLVPLHHQLPSKHRLWT
jgi:hypothetical protein